MLRSKLKDLAREYKYIYLFIIILILMFVISFSIGRYPLSIGLLIKVLFSKVLPIAKTWPETIDTIVFKIRFPRIIAAILVGGSLSVSGAVYQGMFKNPLVSPDILGVSSGAAFGAALAIFVSFSTIGIQITSFLFGLIGVALVYIISIKMKEEPVISLVITGVLVSSIFTSLTSAIKYVADTNDKLPTITFWLMGSLANITSRDLKSIIIPMTIGIIPLYILRWRLNVLSLSEDEAKTLGLDTGKVRIIVVICSTLMTAAAVSISGMIGWIGLVIPHLSRKIVGPDYKVLLPTTILLGSIYLLLIDNIARSVTTVEIPIGILTSLVGAPFFIFLLLTNKRS